MTVKELKDNLEYYDRVQASHDPDNAMVNTIDRINEDTGRLKEKLRRLEEANERYEELIYSADGIGGDK